MFQFVPHSKLHLWLTYEPANNSLDNKRALHLPTYRDQKRVVYTRTLGICAKAKAYRK